MKSNIRSALALLVAGLLISAATAGPALAFSCTPMNSSPPLANTTFQGQWYFNANGIDCNITLSKFGVVQAASCRSSGFAGVTPSLTGYFKMNSQCAVSGSIHIVAGPPQNHNAIYTVLRGRASQSDRNASIIFLTANVSTSAPSRVYLQMMKIP